MDTETSDHPAPEPAAAPPPEPGSASEPAADPTPDAPSLVVGEDGRARPAWAATVPLLREYYDTEWGMPVTDEAGLFERLVLEAFQSGLSWRTVLAKRPRFREVFTGFDPDAVAAFDDRDVERLLGDAGIVRNRLKIEAAIATARAVVALRDEEFEPVHPDSPGAGPAWTGPGDRPARGLAGLVWAQQPAATPRPEHPADVPSASPESTALAKELKRRGARFVGPTTAYALMEAVGVVDTHLLGSWRRGASGVWA